MKEQIYTIPINEAIEQDCFCPFCAIEERLEKEAIEYTLGAAMMEPDFRIFTNERGFCRKHIHELQGQRKALSLALVIETHLNELSGIMEGGLKSTSGSFLKRRSPERENFVRSMKKVSDSCAVCEKVEKTLSRYYETFVFMLKREKGFIEKILKIDGFCMEHFSRLADAALDGLSEKEFGEYFVPIIELQKKRLEKYHSDVKKFADSFDYRNAGKPLEVPRDTLAVAAMLLNGEAGTEKE